MKENAMANLEQYRAVLDDLLRQRGELIFKVGEIDSAVSALRRLMPIESSARPRESQPALPIVTPGKYSGMSVRWAILALLSEDAHSPMTTGDIAEALTAGGVTSGSKSFAGNVSAVLSGMNREKGEVIASTAGWTVSEKGKSTWIRIKTVTDARENSAMSSLETTEPQQPSLQ